MQFSKSSWKERPQADVLVIPFWKDKTPALACTEKYEGLQSFLKLGDFTGKVKEVFLFYPENGKEKRIALLGLGEKGKCNLETLRKSYGALIKYLRTKKILSASFVLPKDIKFSSSEIVRAIGEAILLMNYSFDRLRPNMRKDSPIYLLQKAIFLGIDAKQLQIFHRLQKIFSGVYFTRDLVNDNADSITPEKLASVAMTMGKKYPKISVTVFDKAQITKEKMGLLLAVARASAVDPRFIVIEYKGTTHTKEHTVLVGKGVTYDTGGLSLKPTDNMMEQKTDMAGAGTVLGTILAIAELDLKVHVTGVIPTTENAIGPKSYKPGDVYCSRAGKMVEISNTDAEGRLILADALDYAVDKLKPTRIIDMATLTGGVIVALGDDFTGYFTNKEKIGKQLEKAAEITGELLWQLPLYKPYKDLLKSKIADFKNSAGRPAHAIQGALFLHEFVGKLPWAHLDIAGSAYMKNPKDYYPEQGTGVPVRLLVEFLQQ